MARTNESGKIQLLKGTLHFLWEEAKTFNRFKFNALKKIAAGYFKMKFKDPKKPAKKPHQISLVER